MGIGTILSLILRLAPAIPAIEADFANEIKELSSTDTGKQKIAAALAALKDVVTELEAVFA